MTKTASKSKNRSATADESVASTAASVYFAPLLPWQERAWEQFKGQCREGNLPHGLLATGMNGIGKRAFVWRAVAYQLCQSPAESGACGACQSCVWLQAGTHPDLMVLPAGSLPTDVSEETSSIKIDDVRGLQDFSHLQSRGVRIVVLDKADSLTLGAANALLKTLEEPREGVFLWLISDHSARLLPTIKSRVQALPLTMFDIADSQQFVQDCLHISEDEAQQLLRLADGAPLSAIALKNSEWFDKRKLWLQTFVALRQGARLPVQASDYWQEVVSFADFCQLSRMMLSELYRIGLGLPSLHTDIDVAGVLGDFAFDEHQLTAIFDTLNDSALSLQQNVQEKLAYDNVFLVLAGLGDKNHELSVM